METQIAYHKISYFVLNCIIGTVFKKLTYFGFFFTVLLLHLVSFLSALGNMCCVMG
jgi:hypothetical protein